MLTWVFHAPPLHSYFSFPHVLLRSDLLLVVIFSPSSGFTAKNHHMQQQTEGSEQKATHLLLGREHKNGLKTPQAHEATSALCLSFPRIKTKPAGVYNECHWRDKRPPLPVIDFRVAFPPSRTSPTTRYLCLAARQACFLPEPAAHTAQRCWED